MRLSPTARATPLTEAVTSVAYEDIAAFLSTGGVLQKDQVDELPYMLASRGDHLVAAAGNTIYIRRNTSDELGQRFNIVKVGDELIDPDTDRAIGYQGIIVGAGTLRRGGDPATLAITESIDGSDTRRPSDSAEQRPAAELLSRKRRPRKSTGVLFR